ncbi:MAG: WbqC family protein [bacterium]
MKIGIMQPYFFPYIGYFQLIKSVDKFVVYDNIKYTKKGWINRNRFLQNRKATNFFISIKKDSDYLDVKDRIISVDFNKIKLLNKMKEAYKKAPYFKQIFYLFEKVLLNNETNLFKYIYFSIKEICKELKIETEIVICSNIGIDHSIKSQDKVIDICQYFDASTYINAIGGQRLYSNDIFREHGLDLKFIKSMPIEYQQFNNAFVPWLSIIDVMMFNDPIEMGKLLDNYELI